MKAKVSLLYYNETKNAFKKRANAVPTTSKGADRISVWNVGASADTSHLNLPAIAGVACCSTTRRAPERDIYKFS